MQTFHLSSWCVGTHIVFAEFWAISPKRWGNSTFPQNFHTRKLGEIKVFCVVVQADRLIIGP